MSYLCLVAPNLFTVNGVCVSVFSAPLVTPLKEAGEQNTNESEY